MKFVLLEYAWTKDGKRKQIATPLHIYEGEPGNCTTLCGREVPREAFGWFATGRPLDDPAFPLGPICDRCRQAIGANE